MSDITEAIADCIVKDHIDLLRENKNLREQNAELAALLQEKIEDEGHEEYSAAQARAQYERGYLRMDWVARAIEALAKARGEA